MAAAHPYRGLKIRRQSRDRHDPAKKFAVPGIKSTALSFVFM